MADVLDQLANVGYDVPAPVATIVRDVETRRQALRDNRTLNREYQIEQDRELVQEARQRMRDAREQLLAEAQKSFDREEGRIRAAARPPSTFTADETQSDLLKRTVRALTAHQVLTRASLTTRRSVRARIRRRSRISSPTSFQRMTTRPFVQLVARPSGDCGRWNGSRPGGTGASHSALRRRRRVEPSKSSCARGRPRIRQ